MGQCPVRQAWLSEAFLTRTAPPKGAETFLAVAVAHGEHTEDYHRLYLKLVRGSQDQDDAYWNASSKIEARISAATPRQALMLALALIVCEWESTTSRNTWRHPGERDRRYLTALIGWGYKPSDVEQLVLADTTQAETTDPEVPDKDIQQVEVEQVEVEQVEVERVEDERVEDEPDQDGDDGD